MQPLDATEYGNPAECRGVADWLRHDLRAMFEDSAEDVEGVRSGSCGAWTGTAGDAFRDAVVPYYMHSMHLSGRVDKLGDALYEFANKLDNEVFPKLKQACDRARKGMLEVTEETDAQGRAHRVIGTPGPYQAPKCYPGGGSEQICVDTWPDKRRAYDAAKSLVEDARQQEENAHRDLRKALGKADEGLLRIQSTLQKVLGAKGEIATNVKRLLQAAQEMSETGAILEKVRMGEKLSDADMRTAAMWMKLDGALGAKVSDSLSQRAEAVSKFADEIREHAMTQRMRTIWERMNPKIGVETITDDVGNRSRRLVVFTVPDDAAKKLRGVPLIGTSYVILDGTIDLTQRGKSVEEVLAKTGVDIAEGGVVGAATSWGSKVFKLGGLIGAVGSTIVLDVLKPHEIVDDNFLDDEFKDLVEYKE